MWPSVSGKAIALVIGVALIVVGVFGLGMQTGKSMYAPAAEVVSNKPGVIQADQSVIAERKADESPAPAPHKIPRGMKEERRVAVTVKPNQPECDPVRVDLSLVQDGEGGKRVIASSPDGEVVGALDVPIVPALIAPEPKRWAAGASYDVQEKSGGIWIERDIARVRIGAEAIQGESGITARLRVGFTF